MTGNIYSARSCNHSIISSCFPWNYLNVCVPIRHNNIQGNSSDRFISPVGLEHEEREESSRPGRITHLVCPQKWSYTDWRQFYINKRLAVVPLRLI